MTSMLNYSPIQDSSVLDEVGGQKEVAERGIDTEGVARGTNHPEGDEVLSTR